MKVVLSFDREYGSRERPDLGDAFWLIESPPNRALAEKAWATSAADANSAVFRADAQASDEDVEGRFVDIDLHHPVWTEILVVGSRLTSGLRGYVASQGWTVAPASNGFVVSR